MILVLFFLITCKTIPTVSYEDPVQPAFSMMWQKVDSLEKAALPKSAMAVVLEIKRTAQINEDQIEQVKAIIYENKYMLELNDVDLDTVIDNLEREIGGLNSPAKEILHSYTAELYVHYLQQNRYKLQDRKTQAIRPENTDLMSIQDLVNLADSHYTRSIANPDLNQVLVDKIQKLLNPGGEDSVLTSTLYEFLVSRSLDHFESSFRSSPVGQHVFSLNDGRLFLPRVDFVQLNLDPRDSLDRRFRTIQIYQKALSILSAPDNLDLRRLAYVYENANYNDKEKLYEDAIKYLINNSLDIEHKAKSSHHLASFYFQKDEILKAYATCQATLQTDPNTDGALRCQQLIQQIEMPSMKVQTEKVGIPGQPLLTHLAYKNLNSIHYRMVRLNESEKEQFYTIPYEEQLPFLLNRPALVGDEVILKDSADFKVHATEFMIPSLPKGSYILLVASSERFNATEDAISVSTIHISNLAFSTTHFRGSSDMVCFNRLSGLPQVNVTVHWYQQTYDQRVSRQVRTRVGQSTSDENGLVTSPASKGNFLPVLTLADDTLNLQDFFFNNYGSVYNPTATDEVSIFLDRSIYRPGQLVYFKGIVLQRNTNGDPSVTSNQSIKVMLYDANGQEVSSLMRISNPYGSFHGSFVLPESGLLGQMSIGTDINYQRQTFQVENYKRPSFEVVVDTIAPARLGDLIVASGNVRSYAGAPLGNVEASYRVIRRVRYPFYSIYSRFPQPPQSEREIISGSLRTGKDGTFAFDFTALVDDQIVGPFNAVFDFEITVTATDVSGESQAGTQLVSLGKQPFGVQMLSQGLLDLSVDHQIRFKALTPVGHSVPISGKLVFKRFQMTGTWHRNRYWEVPDLPGLRQSDYIDSLQWYASPYEGKNQTESVAVAEVQGAMENEHFVVDFKGEDLQAGRYQLQLQTQDRSGQMIESEFEVEVVNPDTSYVPSNQLLYILSSDQSYEPGDECILKIASPGSAALLWSIERENVLETRTWQNLNGWEEIKIPIKETDRGGIFIHFQVAYENRILHETIALDIPWTNKILDIQVLTLREVTEPGSEETVELKIEADLGNPSKSEVLASMFDASLDALFPHQWTIDFYRKRHSQFNQYGAGYDIAYANLHASGWYSDPIYIKPLYIPTLNWFGFPFYRRLARSMEAMQSKVLRSDIPSPAPQDVAVDDAADGGLEKPADPITIRENFNENLFFYPEMITDEVGNLSIRYQMNDALTTWRLMLLAHNQELASAYHEIEIVSRKELMITTNRPRFLRSGDELIFTSKIDNLTSEDLPTRVRLDLKNAITGELLDELILSDVSFDTKIDANSSVSVQWKLIIPDTFHFPIEYTVYANGIKHSDAERAVIPVLENRIFVTATRAFEVKGLSTEAFAIDQLIGQGSDGADLERLILDFTSNPTWYAIKALPYLMDYPYECSEQIFNRFFANSLGIKLTTDNPSIEKVFKQWRGNDLRSSLLNDQDLKSALTEETPWLGEALSESEQMRRIAMYFETNTMRSEQQITFEKLRSRQLPDGGFSWFPEGPSNWFISLYIAEGLIQMHQWLDEPLKQQTGIVIDELLGYLDQVAIRYYNELEKQVEKGTTKWEDDHLSPALVYYLYIRSLRKSESTPDQKRVFEYFLSQAKTYWTNKSVFTQAQLSQVFSENELTADRKKIISSLVERMISNPDQGAYWKASNGYTWWQMPVATQSKMIEVFSEEGDNEIVNQLKRWLLNQKRTSHWSTTKATSEAVRSLTLGPSNWLKDVKPVEVTLNDGMQIDMLDNSEAGSFRQKIIFLPEKAKNISSLSLKNPNEQPAWGAAYLQYFENLDQINEDVEGPLKVRKKVFLETFNDRGPLLQAIQDRDLTPGDVLVVQLEIESDRDMEFIHIKDHRGAGVEPVSVLSRFEYQSGLGYYFSLTDLTANFFVDYLPKGKFVLQYEMRVSQKGDFSTGNCTIQSMYAPEFAAHSKGERFKVKSIQ